MPKNLTDMISEFDATLNSEEAVTKSTEEEVTEVVEQDAPDTVEAPEVEGEADANTETEEVTKSEDAKDDKESDKEDDKEVEKADEDKEADKEADKEDVKKSDDKEDEEETEEAKKADADKETDEDADKAEDEVKKSEGELTLKPEATVGRVTTADGEELLKSSDVIGAFEVVLKGMTQLNELQKSLAETVANLATELNATKGLISETNSTVQDVKKSMEDESESVAKSLEKAVPTEGKAVGFVQKSVDATEIEAPAEPDVEVVVEDAPKDPISLAQRTRELRTDYLDAFKKASVTNSRGELATIKDTYLRLGNGNGTEHDFEAVNSFIDKFK